MYIKHKLWASSQTAVLPGRYLNVTCKLTLKFIFILCFPLSRNTKWHLRAYKIKKDQKPISKHLNYKLLNIQLRQRYLILFFRTLNQWVFFFEIFFSVFYFSCHIHLTPLQHAAGNTARIRSTKISLVFEECSGLSYRASELVEQDEHLYLPGDLL